MLFYSAIAFSRGLRNKFILLQFQFEGHLLLLSLGVRYDDGEEVLTSETGIAIQPLWKIGETGRWYLISQLY